MSRSVACLLLLVALAAPGWAQPTVRSDEKTQDYGEAIDIVIVAEGYLDSEQELFFTTAAGLGRKLRVGSTAKPMRDAYTFNLHYVFVASSRHVSWRPKGKPRQTACRAFVAAEGVLNCDDARADAIALESAPDVDSVVILANLDPPEAEDPATFGALAEVVSHPDHVRAYADMPSDGKRVRQPATDPDSFIHELGHALFGLGDEYGEYEGDFPEAELGWEIALTPNLTTDPTGARWRHIVDSVYEGGGYYSEGVYRPEKHCRMRESRSEKFCEVCAAAIRGVPQVEVPDQVTITAPTDGAKVVPGSMFSAHTALTWKTASSPLYYAVELYRAKYADDPQAEPVWESYVEGHLRKLSLPLPISQPGRYEVRIFAVNLFDDTSDPDAIQFELRAFKSVGAGLAQAVQGN